MCAGLVTKHGDIYAVIIANYIINDNMQKYQMTKVIVFFLVFIHFFYLTDRHSDTLCVYFGY